MAVFDYNGDLQIQKTAMTKNLIIKTIVFGFLSWLIPFVTSFLFYAPGGELVVPYSTFKSSIMVVGTLSGCLLLMRYFQLVKDRFLWTGMTVGWVWFAINIILDTLFLIPIMKSTFWDYFISIGLGYLSIPIISMAMAYLLEARQARFHKAT